MPKQRSGSGSQEQKPKRASQTAIRKRMTGSVLSDRYKIQKRIGEGGMGRVYLAEDLRLNKMVAVKVLPQSIKGGSDKSDRLIREARIAAQIDHENIVNVTDLDVTEDGIPYYVMEHMKGDDLAYALNQQGHLSFERVKDISLQVCSALSSAHDKGIVHRDMKPDNIFLLEIGGRKDFVKIFDFGIAKLYEESQEDNTRSKKSRNKNANLTLVGSLVGTPKYMAPEQITGSAIDNRTDIYAVGIMMYEMLCGEVPFHDKDYEKILEMHLGKPVMPFSKMRPDLRIRTDIEAVVFRALQKKPEERYQSIGEMAAELLKLKATEDMPVYLRFQNTATESRPSRLATAYLEIREREQFRAKVRWRRIAGAIVLAASAATFASEQMVGRKLFDAIHQTKTEMSMPATENIGVRATETGEPALESIMKEQEQPKDMEQSVQDASPTKANGSEKKESTPKKRARRR